MYLISSELKAKLEKYLYRDLSNDSTCVETNELLDELEELHTNMRDYENDPDAFEDAVTDFFYDDYFKGKEGHDYEDEEITMSVNKGDIDDCLNDIKAVLYNKFNIKED